MPCMILLSQGTFFLPVQRFIRSSKPGFDSGIHRFFLNYDLLLSLVNLFCRRNTCTYFRFGIDDVRRL